MTTKTTSMKHALSFAALALLAGGVQAQSAGDITVSLGATTVRPQVVSSDLTRPSLPGTQLSVGPATQVSAGINYQLTDSIAFDLPISRAYTHDVLGAGAIENVGKIGEVKALPVTMLVQWRILGAGSKVRPFVGVGPTYARIGESTANAALSGITGGSPAKPTTLSLKSAWGVTFQVGASVAISGPWSVEASYLKSFISSSGKLSTGQTIDLKLNPDVVSASIAYRF